MAFGLFGRRRRDDDRGRDLALATAAATGIAVGSRDIAAVLTAAQPSAIDAPVDGAAPAVAAAGAAAGAEEEEAAPESDMPRWRRPSLILARKTDPIRDDTPAPRLTFDRGLVGPLAGHERRVIRYRVVRLLDAPDELRGAELAYLDRGDEVQLLEKYGAYWLVLCPDGQQGWLHKMTLGEVVDADAPTANGPNATMPTVADSWTMGDAGDGGDDVFRSYLATRRRDD
jgi:hypothetical protein